MEWAAATTIEITITSAEELRVKGHPLSKGAFVVVRPGDDKRSQASTHVNRDGGSYPCWNEKLTLTLPPSARSISVEVCCRRGGGVQPVAAAEVPVSDFVWLEDYLHLLSYRLKESNWKRNGIINFSIRVVKSGRFTSYLGF